MPAILSFSSASRTSSTLCGRTMLLISFIPFLHPGPAWPTVLLLVCGTRYHETRPGKSPTASIASLQHLFEFACQRLLLVVGQFDAVAGHVQHVDRPLPFRRDEREVKIAAL